MFNIKCWWNPREDDLKQTVVKVAIRCGNCGKETMIDVDNIHTTYQDIITTFLLNKMLHYVGMLCIIEAHDQLKYDMDTHNSDWLTGGPWYNTYICNKLHGNVFEGFIINARTYRCHIMCYIDANEKKHPLSSCEDGSSSGVFPLTTNSTTEALESLSETIDFIGCWLKALEHNFLERCNFCTHYMEECFHKIPVGIPNQPSPK